MSRTHWNEDGVRAWRTAGPPALVDLYIASSQDYSVADTIALSGSLPVALHLSAPERARMKPYILVEPLGTPATTVSVTLHAADGSALDTRDVEWDAQSFEHRVALGEVITELAKKTPH